MLARSLGRLRFAGEATSREHPATVVGACLSGLQAAGEVDRTCRGLIQEMRDEDGEETPAHRRRRISEANVPSFRKRESDATPLKDSNTDTPTQRPALLFTLPSTEPLAPEESGEMKVDVESIRRNIQAQQSTRPPSVPPPPSVAPPSHVPNPTAQQPFLGGPLTGAQYFSPTSAPHALVPQPAADVAPTPAAASASSSLSGAFSFSSFSLPKRTLIYVKQATGGHRRSSARSSLIWWSSGCAIGT